MTNRENKKADMFWFTVGASLAALAVILGAFGAHGLESRLRGHSEDRLGQWETASRYQMYHSIGIILISFCFALFGKRFEFTFAAFAFLIGIILFSGVLYALVLTDLSVLGAIVPLGGLAMISGWASLAIAAIRMSSQDGKDIEK